MSVDIAMSLGTRRSLAAYQSLSAQVDVIQARIATGKRVNSALDNPAAFFTASALTSRAATLHTAIDNISNAKQTVEAAFSGVEALQLLISTARDLAADALASASTIAKVTGTVSGLTGAFDLSAFDSNDTITVSDGTTTATYTYSNNDPLQDFLDAVNNTANLNVEASLSSNGSVVLQATSTNNITIGGSSSSSEKATIGLVAGTTTFSTSTFRQSLAIQFDTIRSQINDVASDAGFNSTNLLAGSSLTIKFNETGSSQLVVSGTSLTASGLGINTASTGGGGSFQLDSEIDSFLTALDAASATLDVQASMHQSNFDVIAIREEFTNNMIDILTTGADDLVLADTDAESAMLLALQARQELVATTLSIVGDSENMALRLFGVA